jgi:nucleoside-diphosphate-sugar epimerase
LSGNDAGSSDDRILVTGAAGAIGGRLVEKLVREPRTRVRAVVHDLARAARIARFPVELVAADITDPDSIREAAVGCDVVVHCAYGSRGTAADRRRVNVQGTRNVLEAALRAGSRRVVHLSTLVVYGFTPESVLCETAPRRRSGDAYGDDKLDAERLAFEFHREQGLAVSVIQPTAVYGPFAPAWTERVLDQLKSGIVPLIGGGNGICNIVYIDDVVDAVVLAARREEAVGEAFLISGEAITYRDFYGRFAEMLVGQRTASLSVDEALERWRTNSDAPLAESGMPVHILDPVWIRFQSLTTTVSTEKARRRLGFQPRIDFETGMRLTERWASWANMLPAPTSRHARD